MMQSKIKQFYKDTQSPPLVKFSPSKKYAVAYNLHNTYVDIYLIEDEPKHLYSQHKDKTYSEFTEIIFEFIEINDDVLYVMNSHKGVLTLHDTKDGSVIHSDINDNKLIYKYHTTDKYLIAYACYFDKATEQTTCTSILLYNIFEFVVTPDYQYVYIDHNINNGEHYVYNNESEMIELLNNHKYFQQITLDSFYDNPIYFENLKNNILYSISLYENKNNLFWLLYLDNKLIRNFLEKQNIIIECECWDNINGKIYKNFIKNIVKTIFDIDDHMMVPKLIFGKRHFSHIIHPFQDTPPINNINLTFKFKTLYDVFYVIIKFYGPDKQSIEIYLNELPSKYDMIVEF